MKTLKILVKFFLVLVVIFLMLHFKIIEIPSIDILFNSFTLLILPIIFISIVIHNFGWWLLLRAQKYNITYLKSLFIYLAGTFFNIVMPGGVGGDAARCMYLYMYIKPNEKTSAMFTVIISRIIGLHALLSLCLFIGIFYYEKIINNGSLSIIYIAITTIFLLSLLFLFIYKIYYKKILSFFLNLKNKKESLFRRLIYSLLKNINSYREKMRYVFYSWCISLISHTVFISIFYFMSIQLGINYISFFENIIVGGLSFISNSLPITPGGIGIGESVYNYFYKLFLNNSDYNNIAFGSIFFLSYRVLYYFVCIFCGISFIFIGKPQDKYTNDGFNNI